MPTYYTFHEGSFESIHDYLDAHPEINDGDIITYASHNQMGIKIYKFVKTVEEIGDYNGLYANQNNLVNGGKRKNKSKGKTRSKRKGRAV